MTSKKTKTSMKLFEHMVEDITSKEGKKKLVLHPRVHKAVIEAVKAKLKADSEWERALGFHLINRTKLFQPILGWKPGLTAEEAEKSS